jgi:hypothetical protein
MSALDRLKAGTRNEKTVTFPGTDKKVVIRVLTVGEGQEAAFEAERYFHRQEIALHEGTIEAYEKEKTTRMLHRALRDPDSPDETFAADAEELKKLLTEDEREALVAEYLALQEAASPLLGGLTEERFALLLDEVKKNGGEAVGSISSIGTLRRLVTSLACPPTDSPMASGSTSS